MERLLRGAHTLWERTTKRLVSSRNIKHKWTAGQISAKIQRDLDSVGTVSSPHGRGAKAHMEEEDGNISKPETWIDRRSMPIRDGWVDGWTDIRTNGQMDG